MEDSRIVPIGLKRHTPSDVGVNDTKRRKRDSDHGHHSHGLSSNNTEISSQDGVPHFHKSASARLPALAPSVNWNSGSKAKIGTKLGGGPRNLMKPDTEGIIKVEPDFIIDAPQQSEPSDTGLGGPYPSFTQEVHMSNNSRLPQLPANTANNTSLSSTQVQTSTPRTLRLGVLPDSLTRRLVEEGASITVAQQLTPVTQVKKSPKKTPADKTTRPKGFIRSCLEDFIRRCGNEGLLELISTSFVVARYATKEQATRAMDALKIKVCKSKGVVVLTTIKTFDQSTQLGKKFASMMEYYSNPVTSSPTQGEYADLIQYLQNLSPMNLQCTLDALPRLPIRKHDAQDGGDVRTKDESAIRSFATVPADKIFLRQIERQASVDPIRRSAIHLAEVAYTDRCITDNVYDVIMLALLTFDECNEKQIGNNKRFETPAKFRNWFEIQCLNVWNGHKGAEAKKKRLQIAAELGRAELSEIYREGVKRMGCSVTSSDSKCPTPSNVVTSSVSGLTQQKPPTKGKGKILDDRPISKIQSIVDLETLSIDKDTGASTSFPRKAVPLPSLQGSEETLEIADLALLSLGSDGNLRAARTDLVPPTRLFVRPLPLNEGQAEFVALFDGYQTESISRAVDTNGDLHYYGVVVFTTAAEAARAKTNLQGNQVRNHRVSLSYRGKIGEHHDIITVPGNTAAKNLIWQSHATLPSGDKGNQTGGGDSVMVTDLSPGKLIGSASSTPMDGAYSKFGNLPEDNQVGNCDMVGDAESDAAAMTEDTKAHYGVAFESTMDQETSPDVTATDVEINNDKYEESGDIEMSINDETIDAMLAEYAQSERLQPPKTSASNSFEGVNADVKHLSSAMENPVINTVRPTVLADLSQNDLEMQLAYEFAPNGNTSEVDPQLLVTCLICRGKGHMAAICPTLTCHGCGAYRAHPARACPALRKCKRCRQPGHTEEACTSKLAFSATADGLKCDLCQQEGHLEADCSKLWRTFDPVTAPKLQVTQLSIYCYECGNRGHFGGDCLKHPPGKGASCGPNIWTLAYVKKCIDVSKLKSSSIDQFVYGGGKSRFETGLSVKGRAQRNPIVLDSDSNDDSTNFYRPKVAAQSSSRGQIRIASNAFTSNSRTGSSWTSINPPYDERSSYQSHRDQENYYRPVSRPMGRESRRSRSPEFPYSGRPVKDRYRQDPRDDRIDRWQPPLPREPLPTRGAGRVGGGNWNRGALLDSTTHRGETYRPMPSAAKNARMKYMS